LYGLKIRCVLVKTWHFMQPSLGNSRTLLTVHVHVYRDGVISNGTFSSSFPK